MILVSADDPDELEAVEQFLVKQNCPVGSLVSTELTQNFIETLSPGWILFGEWCFAKHSIYYDKLPDWFLAFDVFDMANHEFLSTIRRNKVAESLGLATVPRLAAGRFNRNEILELITDSKLANGPMEGVYLRKENDSVLIDRAKIVRAEFTQAISEHWSKKTLRKNKLQT